MSNDATAPRAPDTPAAPRKVVDVAHALDRAEKGNIVVALIAAVVSVVAHALLILVMMNISLGTVDAGATAEDVEAETRIEEPQKPEPDLTNTDIGLDSSVPTQYPVDNLQEISVPDPADPTSAAGIHNAPEGPAITLPP